MRIDEVCGPGESTCRDPRIEGSRIFRVTTLGDPNSATPVIVGQNHRLAMTRPIVRATIVARSDSTSRRNTGRSRRNGLGADLAFASGT
jgi:hypothetical protein